MKLFLVIFLLCITVQSGYSQNQILFSPDGKSIVEIFTKEDLSYSVKHYDETILKRSPLSMKVGDETIPLDGKIGEYLVVARRAGKTWYVGGINGDEARELEVILPPILKDHKSIIIHADGINAFKEGKDFRLYNAAADKNCRLAIKMASGGGFAAII
jgi:hypothetical protein